jgi:hypothetical protein
MKDLNALYLWFDTNRPAIIDGHQGEFVLLKDNAAQRYFSDTRTALSAVRSKGLKMGDFLIQRCNTEEEDTMHYYNQAVSFG